MDLALVRIESKVQCFRGLSLSLCLPSSLGFGLSLLGVILQTGPLHKEGKMVAESQMHIISV